MKQNWMCDSHVHLKAPQFRILLTAVYKNMLICMTAVSVHVPVVRYSMCYIRDQKVSVRAATAIRFWRGLENQPRSS